MLVIRVMYEDATAKVRLNGRESKTFSVKVGVDIRDLFSVCYCSSLLCWRLCLESSGKVCLWNCFMQIADDLVLMAESEEVLIEKLMKWKKDESKVS